LLYPAWTPLQIRLPKTGQAPLSVFFPSCSWLSSHMSYALKALRSLRPAPKQYSALLSLDSLILSLDSMPVNNKFVLTEKSPEVPHGLYRMLKRLWATYYADGCV
jgi:hypothetical protein